MPSKWPLVPISQLVSESRIPGTTGERARKLTVKLYGRGVVPKDERRTGSEQTRYYQRRSGQLVYSKLDFLNGAFALIPPELDGYETTLDLPSFDLSDKVDGNWLVRFLARPSFYKRFAGIAHGSRKARRVNPEEFLQIEIPLPPINEQRKIATILSSVDEAIEKAQAVIDQVEIVGRGLLEELIPSDPQGRNAAGELNLHSSTNKWTMLKVGELGDFSGGNGFRPTDWSSQGLPIIRIQNLNDSKDFNYYNGVPAPEWIVEPGELLFAWAGSRGSSFGPCIWPGPRGVLNQHIYRIKPKRFVDKRFLYLLLKRITAIIERRAHGFKDTLVHLRKSELTDWEVLLPPVSEQERVATIFDSFKQRLSIERSTLETLKSMKAALVDDLVSGRTQVPTSIQEAA